MNDIQTVANEMLDNSKFESGWSKKLKNSQNKSREWLFRHATECYEFQQACKNKELNLPASVAVYYSSKMEEWLGYSKDLSSKWARAGGFIVKGIEDLSSSGATQLPASIKTIIEYARMDKDELKACEEAQLIHPEVTYQDVADFRASYKQERKEAEVKAEAKHKQHKENIEEDVLAFKYDDKVPEWIIEKIEDLATEIPKEKIGPTLKFTDKLSNGQDSTWVCTLMKNTWSATQFIKGAEPKDEKQEKYKHEKTQADKEREGYESFFAKYLAVFGIDIEEGKIKPETIKWLLDGFRRAHHPDKGEHNAELTQTAVTAAKKLEAFARENSK